MAHIHVCLVSDQTIPNILGIYHFKPDEVVFISTEAMQRKQKVKHITNVLKKLEMSFENLPDTITVLEDSIVDCNNALESWAKGREEEKFTVNLTGGTKIMSIAAYEFFKDFDSEMIYIPIPKNEFIKPSKKRRSVPVKLDLRLTVAQYLSAYGVDILNEANLNTYRDQAVKRKMLSELIVKGYESAKNLLAWLYTKLEKHRKKKEYTLNDKFLEATSTEETLLRKLGFSHENNYVSKKLTKNEIKYVTGGWLEEYCFNEVEKIKDMEVDDVVMGVSLRNRYDRDNEFDVMFTASNALYFVECKSLDQDNDKGTEVLYKIGALQKEFGLKVKSYLVTTSPFILKEGEIKEAIKARAEQFNTEIIRPSDVSRFGRILAESLKSKRTD